MNLRRRVSWGLADQIASSLSNMVLIFGVARSSDPGGFGTFSLGFAVLVFFMGVQRSSLGAIVAVSDPRAGSPLLLSTMFGALASVSGLAVTALSADKIYWAAIIVLSAGPILLTQDILRYRAVALGRASDAFQADALWLMFLIAGMGIVQMRPSTATGLLLACLWVLGGVASLVVLIHKISPVWAVRDWMKQHAKDLLTAGGDAVLATAAPLVVSLSIAIAFSVTDVGAYRGAGSLMGPVALVMSALPLVVLPEMTRLDRSNRAKLAGVQSLALSTVTGVWLLLILLTPASIGFQILGPSWEGARSILLLVGVEMAIFAFSTGPSALLRVARNWSVMFRIRLCYIAVLAGALPYGLARDLDSVLLCMVAAAFLNAVLLCLAAGRIHRHAGILSDSAKEGPGS